MRCSRSPLTSEAMARPGEAEDVVVEAVLLVPHPVGAFAVDGRGDPEEVLGELGRHVVVALVVRGELDGDLDHALAEERHPGRAVRLLEVPAGRERRGAIEDADVVEAEEPTLDGALPESILPVHPPEEVGDELPEGAPEEGEGDSGVIAR
jgi:hypothetical protein